MATRNGDLTLREAAEALGLSMGTVRSYVKKDKLKASQRRGRFGDEYRIRPAVLSAFAAERGLELDTEALGQDTTATPVEPSGDMPADVRELYERLLSATEEATRYKSLCEVSESTKAEADQEHQAAIAELRHERDDARAEAEYVAQELTKLKSRGFWGRLFGSAG